MEEFQEADVLWPDHHRSADDNGCHDHGHQPQRRERRLHHNVDAARSPRHGSSAPLGIPEGRSTTTEHASLARRHYYSDDGDGLQALFVAPHEMVARRRCAEDVERSVCVGHGRTLKGRDLRSVRTAVLRMTGFLET